MSRFFLGAMVLSEPVLEVVRRELRRVSPGVKIQVEEIRKALTEEVLKREVVEGDKAEEARRKINRVQGRSLRKAKGGEADSEEEAPAVPVQSSAQQGSVSGLPQSPA
jgi:hypothetical protein